MTPILGHFSQLTYAFGAQPLFTDLQAQLQPGLSGLMGNNGEGKSVLLQLLAGVRQPTAGSIHWAVEPYWVDQLFQPAATLRIGDMLATGDLYDCFSRIDCGNGSTQDLDRVSALWHLPAYWRAQLAQARLDYPLATPVQQLSGGEQTRLRLCAALQHPQRYLLLDEPTNHLDNEARSWLTSRLLQHPGGALVVSHDRALLEQVHRLLVLQGGKLTCYGGGYRLAQEIIDTEQQAQRQRLAEIQRQRRQLITRQQLQQQQSARRQRQGEQQRGSQSKLLLDARKGKAEQSRARQDTLLRQRSAQLTQRLHQQQQALLPEGEQRLQIGAEGLRGGIKLHLQALQLCRGSAAALSLTLYAGERWQLLGANGSGKSTLLQTIAGLLPAAAGHIQRSGRCCYLDQHFSLLQGELSPLENLRWRHPDIDDTTWRTRLANLQLSADHALRPVASLSGGERLKVALLAISGGSQPPDLLLLDEPDNHLDINSKRLLEQALADYPGALIVVSHDDTFIAQLALTQSLTLALTNVR